MTQEAVIDKKGRVVIPKQLREKLRLRNQTKVRLTLDDGKLIIAKTVTPEEFINKMEGCIKEDTLLPKTNPLDLKRIWEQT
ncbi:MAG: AbrB/MazE/SpoVT family DNA-binding domain-containing protein [Thaumarchaeota archaeon]|nr:AbrB/MazE/SpoVT family DNA-binding domain-containing protein [Nitrososphaerota archaeon]